MAQWVVLAKDDTLAEVIESYDKREIRIRVVGKHKRDLLTIITHELDMIHASFNRLKFTRFIPCNCEQCKGSQVPHFYDYESLRNRLANGRYEVECDKSYQMVEVQQLIDDVRERESLAGRLVEGAMGLDKERVANLQALLGQHQRNLDKLKRQAAKYGSSDVPVHVLNQIEDEEKSISNLEDELGGL